MKSNRIWQIQYIAGNPEIYSNIRKTELMKKSEALEAWERMVELNGEKWRMWLTQNEKVIAESIAEKKWRSRTKAVIS